MDANMVLQPSDLAAIKYRQRATWSSGDYGKVAATIQYMSELLCESLDLHADERVLDVATGSGNAAIAAARRMTQVTAIDYAPVLLERAAGRAAAEQLDIAIQEADAEALPFADGTFDVVISVVGVMFAPNQERAAAELARVCRPGGRIAVANWTPDGFIGELLRLVGRFVAPPAGLTSPTRWGMREGTMALLGPAGELSWTERAHRFTFASAEAFAAFFIANYGPTERAFASLDAVMQQEYRSAIARLAAEHNVATDGTLVVPGAYLVTQVRVA